MTVGFTGKEALTPTLKDSEWNKESLYTVQNKTYLIKLSCIFFYFMPLFKSALFRTVVRLLYTLLDNSNLYQSCFVIFSFHSISENKHFKVVKVQFE